MVHVLGSLVIQTDYLYDIYNENQLACMHGNAGMGFGEMTLRRI